MSANINAIVLCDLNEKIILCHKRPTFHMDKLIKNTTYLNKYLKSTYISDHIANQVEIRLIDTMINSKLKVKITLLFEIIIYVFYDADFDLHELNVINLRLIELIHTLFKTRKLRVDSVIKRNTEMVYILEDTLYYLDPRVRFQQLAGVGGNTKEYSIKESISHSIYFYKLSQLNNNGKNFVLNITPIDFITTQRDLKKTLLHKHFIKKAKISLVKIKEIKDRDRAYTEKEKSKSNNFNGNDFNLTNFTSNSNKDKNNKKRKILSDDGYTFHTNYLGAKIKRTQFYAALLKDIPRFEPVKEIERGVIAEGFYQTYSRGDSSNFKMRKADSIIDRATTTFFANNPSTINYINQRNGTINNNLNNADYSGNAPFQKQPENSNFVNTLVMNNVPEKDSKYYNFNPNMTTATDYNNINYNNYFNNNVSVVNQGYYPENDGNNNMNINNSVLNSINNNNIDNNYQINTHNNNLHRHNDTYIHNDGLNESKIYNDTLNNSAFLKMIEKEQDTYNKKEDYDILDINNNNAILPNLEIHEILKEDNPINTNNNNINNNDLNDFVLSKDDISKINFNISNINSSNIHNNSNKEKGGKTNSLHGSFNYAGLVVLNSMNMNDDKNSKESRFNSNGLPNHQNMNINSSLNSSNINNNNINNPPKQSNGYLEDFDFLGPSTNQVKPITIKESNFNSSSNNRNMILNQLSSNGKSGRYNLNVNNNSINNSVIVNNNSNARHGSLSNNVRNNNNNNSNNNNNNNNNFLISNSNIHNNSNSHNNSKKNSKNFNELDDLSFLANNKNDKNNLSINNNLTTNNSIVPDYALDNALQGLISNRTNTNTNTNTNTSTTMNTNSYNNFTNFTQNTNTQESKDFSDLNKLGSNFNIINQSYNFNSIVNSNSNSNSNNHNNHNNIQNFNLNNNISQYKDNQILNQNLHNYSNINNLDYTGNFISYNHNHNNNKEDVLNKQLIKKLLRAALIETAVMVYSKGKYETAKLRGQIALELNNNNNFKCNYKLFYLNVINSYWEDRNYIHLNIKENTSRINLSNNSEETKGVYTYRITCENLKENLSVIDYNINMKMYTPLASFNFNNKHKDDKYKLELAVLTNTKIKNNVNKAEMIVKIILKSSEYKILKSTMTENLVEESNILTYKITNFNLQDKFLIGVLFETSLADLVEVVKLSYRYLSELPSLTNAEFYYYDENKETFYLDVVKKSFVEITFLPN